MALAELKFFSESLGMQTECYVVLPQENTSGEIGIGGKKPQKDKLKCLYLLHGLSDDHSIWLRRTSIERYAADYGICVVMPCAHKSFYCDMKYGMNYYRYISSELPQIIQSFFNVSGRREDNFVAGLSMGGYGALKIALREPDRFCAGAGLSSAVDFDKRHIFSDIGKAIFGENGSLPDEDNLYFLAEKTAKHKNRPGLFMAVGTDDFLYAENTAFRDRLRELGYDLTYMEGPGNHSWEFWDEYIQYVLKWMFEK